MFPPLVLCNFRPTLDVTMTGTPIYSEFGKISNSQMAIVTLVFNCIAIIQEQKQCLVTLLHGKIQPHSVTNVSVFCSFTKFK